MTRTIDNGQDIMDSRDVIAYIEELKTDITYAFEEDDDIPDFDDLVARWDASGTGAITPEFQEACDEKNVGGELEELAPLLALAEEASDSPDWTHGETLIRATYFPTYAEELAEDICPSREVADAMQSWPYRHIDWKAAAAELRYDYFAVDYDGTEYLIRS